MSHYTTTELEVKDLDAFVDALVQCWSDARGKTILREDIEIHETPTNLVGYMGDKREQLANVIIRKNNVGGSSNDIGYMVNDGKATAYISEFDQSKYTQSWQKKVKQRYAMNVATKAAVKKGYKVKEEWVDGLPKLRLSKYVTVGG